MNIDSDCQEKWIGNRFVKLFCMLSCVIDVIYLVSKVLFNKCSSVQFSSLLFFYLLFLFIFARSFPKLLRPYVISAVFKFLNSYAHIVVHIRTSLYPCVCMALRERERE